jgi:hypothetical protein
VLQLQIAGCKICVSTGAANCTLTSLDAKWRAAAVEQFISCSAWRVNMMS